MISILNWIEWWLEKWMDQTLARSDPIASLPDLIELKNTHDDGGRMVVKPLFLVEEVG